MTQLLVMVEGRDYRADFGEGEESIGFLANRPIDANDEKSIDESRLFHRVRDELAANNVSATATSIM